MVILTCFVICECVCGSFVMCGFGKMLGCVCVGFVMCELVCVYGFCNVWVCVCVGFVMCGCVYEWVL